MSPEPSQSEHQARSLWTLRDSTAARGCVNTEVPRLGRAHHSRTVVVAQVLTLGMEAEGRMAHSGLEVLHMAVISECSTVLTTGRRSTSGLVAASATIPRVGTVAARLTYLQLIYRSRPVLRSPPRVVEVGRTTRPAPEVRSFLISQEPIRTQEVPSRRLAALQEICRAEMVEFTSRRAC